LSVLAEEGKLGPAMRGRTEYLLRLAASVAFPAAVTALAALPGRVPTSSAALAFVLAVIGAAVVGGLPAGLTASFFSFLSLNFFFTPPVGTFNVAKTEDLVALVVFLLVSATVGALVSRAVAQRARAEVREREARLLQHLGTRLLSGEPAENVLDRFGRAAIDLLRLARYEARVEGSASVVTGSDRKPDMVEERFPLLVRDREIGAIHTYVEGGNELGEPERQLVRTFAAQLSLAFEGARMAVMAQTARLDADRSKMQAALLSSVTHDLRTPLSSITASVTGLLDDDASFDEGERHDLLETIRQEAVRLNRLVGNLLDLSRLRAGALTPARRPAAIDEIVEGVLARMEPQLRDHRLNLVLREGLPLVPVDVVQLDQVLTNILENAVKYSPKGSEITVAAAGWEDTVQVRIADQGDGIPADLRTEVFEAFARGQSRGGGGSGLGLAIAQAVVQAHGGTIWAEDAPGGGTAIVFRLPIREP
jgi:two-component system, OmpR family, sensor histidine kinase KdpD